jgi:CubicO group peptidase (beta-lactamase class C family)
MRVLAGSSNLREVDLLRPITVRDLLTHTAGLTYDFLEDSPVSALYRQARLMADAERSLEELIDELVRLPLAYQPGTRWQYSFAIDVIARLIEVISGQPLQEFLRERLFVPLQMSDTGFSVAPGKRGRIATMYGLPDVAANSISRIGEAWKKGLNERRDVEATYPADNTGSFARGGHGLFSTALDYWRFAQMLLNRGEFAGTRILAPETVDLMHRNHLPSDLLPCRRGGITLHGYGFGLGSRVLMDAAGLRTPGTVGEFGWDGAAKTFYWIDPKKQLIGIFMAQYMAGLDQPERDFQGLSYQALDA